MKIRLDRTRQKEWEYYYFYLLPTIRFTKSRPVLKNFNEDINRTYKLELIWLTFNLNVVINRD